MVVGERSARTLGCRSPAQRDTKTERLGPACNGLRRAGDSEAVRTRLTEPMLQAVNVGPADGNEDGKRVWAFGKFPSCRGARLHRQRSAERSAGEQCGHKCCRATHHGAPPLGQRRRVSSSFMCSGGTDPATHRITSASVEMMSIPDRRVAVETGGSVAPDVLPYGAGITPPAPRSIMARRERAARSHGSSMIWRRWHAGWPSKGTDGVRCSSNSSRRAGGVRNAPAGQSLSARTALRHWAALRRRKNPCGD